MADRYLKFVLTVIALELLWLAAENWSIPAAAQSAATPVIITGVRLQTAPDGVLPVAVTGTVTIEPYGPLKIEADRPLPVESVPYRPAKQPGE